MATVSENQDATSTDAAISPVLKETRYDLTTAGMIAGFLGLSGLVFWLLVVWFTNRPPDLDSTVPVELFEIPGGSEDGSPDETLRIDSPADVTDDPSMAEFESEETEVQEMIDNVLELAETANNQAQEQFMTDVRNAGKPGSATGTGKRALGSGPGEGGMPREQRWFISFSEGGTLDEYAAQLQFFGIELGALMPDGRLVLLSNLTAKSPTKKVITDGEQEKRMYMVWQGGSLKSGDIKLFEKVGENVSGSIIFHFYPRNTEEMLARLEQTAAKRPVKKIRRTYFVVRKTRDGFTFAVTRQIFF